MIGVIIPTRGDRSKLLNFNLKRMSEQTLVPDIFEVVDDKPLGGKDITYRYRKGAERILSKNAQVEVVFLIEDDDFYSVNYIELMMSRWIAAGKPEIFGIGETYYYHLGLGSLYHQRHPERASAFCTMVTSSGLRKMRWPADDYSFTDIELWKQLSGKTTTFDRTVALGIKGHNQGSLFGGIGHNGKWGGYKKFDFGQTWLKSNVDEEAFELYKIIKGENEN